MKHLHYHNIKIGNCYNKHTYGITTSYVKKVKFVEIKNKGNIQEAIICIYYSKGKLKIIPLYKSAFKQHYYNSFRYCL